MPRARTNLAGAAILKLRLIERLARAAAAACVVLPVVIVDVVVAAAAGDVAGVDVVVLQECR